MKKSILKNLQPTRLILTAMAVLATMAGNAISQQGNSNTQSTQVVPIEKFNGEEGVSILDVLSSTENANFKEVQESSKVLDRDPLTILNELIENPVDSKELDDIEEMAVLRRKISLLELELQKVMLEDKISQFNQYGANGSDEWVEVLRAELETLIAEQFNFHEPEPDIDDSISFPVVLEIFGTNGNFAAKLQVPNVGTVVAKQGAVLPNGMRILAISIDSVEVEYGQSSHLLSMGSDIPLSLSTNID